MKTYTFLTFFALFLFIALTFLGAILYPLSKVPFWWEILGISTIFNVCIWMAIDITKQLND